VGQGGHRDKIQCSRRTKTSQLKQSGEGTNGAKITGVLLRDLRYFQRKAPLEPPALIINYIFCNQNSYFL